ncbi:unnamed protein product, partial [Schistocephalus solidus]|uniref:Secreted protein n=1 Tax=Schistocephalus solidus TaxID=70667 RepID=A0A183TDX9_SCHSO
MPPPAKPCVFEPGKVCVTFLVDSLLSPPTSSICPPGRFAAGAARVLTLKNSLPTKLRRFIDWLQVCRVSGVVCVFTP